MSSETLYSLEIFKKNILAECEASVASMTIDRCSLAPKVDCVRPGIRVLRRETNI